MAFKQLQGETVILVQNGVYKQADLYEWKGGLFAKFSGGFIRLKENGSTTKDGVSIDTLMFDGELRRDKFGRLAVSGGETLDKGRVLTLTNMGDASNG